MFSGMQDPKTSDFTQSGKEEISDKGKQGKKGKEENCLLIADFKSKPWVQTLGRGSSQFFI